MAQQNQKTTRKNQEGKVEKNNKNLKSNSTKKPIKSVKNTEKLDLKTEPSIKITDEHFITYLNQKVKVLSDISTVDGTLHKNEIVKVESIVGFGDINLKVIDNLGHKFSTSNYKNEMNDKFLTKSQQEELKKLISEITDEAKNVVDDYNKNPSEMSGSITQVHENSPYLATREERLFSFDGKRLKINPDKK